MNKTTHSPNSDEIKQQKKSEMKQKCLQREWMKEEEKCAVWTASENSQNKQMIYSMKHNSTRKTRIYHSITTDKWTDNEAYRRATNIIKQKRQHNNLLLL